MPAQLPAVAVSSGNIVTVIFLSPMRKKKFVTNLQNYKLYDPLRSKKLPPIKLTTTTTTTTTTTKQIVTGPALRL
jgi:hypothetical protein